MTTDISISHEGNKYYPEKARASYKISLHDEPILNLSLGSPQRGGQGIGKKHRVRGLYIDKARRVYAGFILTDSSGHSYRYAAVGRLHSLDEEAS